MKRVDVWAAIKEAALVLLVGVCGVLLFAGLVLVTGIFWKWLWGDQFMLATLVLLILPLVWVFGMIGVGLWRMRN